MSDTTHYKAACNHCGGHVEYPAESDGLTIDCPHCKNSLFLYRMQQIIPSPPLNRIKKKGWRTRFMSWLDDVTSVYPPFEKPKPKIQPAKPASYVTPKKDMTPEEFFGTATLVGVVLFLAGVGIVVYYFQFYPLSNPDADVVNSARLHYSLCGVIIGVGLSVIGTIVAAISMAVGIWVFAQKQANTIKNM